MANLVGNLTDDTLTGTAVADILIGGDGNDTLYGLAGNDVLIGNSGADTLVGGAGTDSLIGGAGDDVYLVNVSTALILELADEGIDAVLSSGSYRLSAALERLTLTGSGNTNGTGNALDNLITGNAGANRLNGAAGNDTLLGGLGDDVYVVDSLGDVVTEGLNEGKDRVDAAVDWTLGDNFEKLHLIGSALIGTGNALDNLLLGNALANTLEGANGNDSLDGGAGADVLSGGAGNDVYVVDNAGDTLVELAGGGTDRVLASVSYSLAAAADVERLTLTGSAINGTGNDGNNLLTGNSAANTLSGGGGADTLNGGGGADLLVGGTGDDVYIVSNAGDVVSETGGGGIDRVRAGVTFSIQNFAGVENLTLTGTGAIDGTGNALANAITGNAALNTLTGGGGNDTLDGGAGADVLIGGSGNDYYLLDNVNDKVTEVSGGGADRIRAGFSVDLTDFANVENLSLKGTANLNGTGTSGANQLLGNDGRNTLSGGGGNDSLDGGAGADVLIGGTGNDVYEVDNVGDVVTEAAGGGTDRVRASISFNLAELTNVENLTLTGSANLNATGNSGDNVLAGNAGSNLLRGGAGDDVFRFGGTLGAGNIDTIADFERAGAPSGDAIWLNHLSFSGLATGGLAPTAFEAGTDNLANATATRVIYNTSSGALFFDADGSGVLFSPEQFATLATHPDALAASDFLVI